MSFHQKRKKKDPLSISCENQIEELSVWMLQRAKIPA